MSTDVRTAAADRRLTGARANVSADEPVRVALQLLERRLRSARDALWHTHRQILSVRTVLRATRRYARTEPVRATRELMAAGRRLAKAFHEVFRTFESVKASTAFFEIAGTVPPHMALDHLTTVMCCTGAMITIDKVLEEVGEAMTDLKALVVVYPDVRLRILFPKGFAAPLFAHDSQPAERIQAILRRRRRRAPAAVEDAPKQPSRGRAPPHPLSICSL